MKKLLLALMCMTLALFTAACSDSGSKTENKQEETKKDEETKKQEETKKDEENKEDEKDKDEDSTMPGSVEGGKKYTAVISVDGYGDITLTLDEGIAPKTVDNFVKLANEGFYDGLTFHRIMDGFMIQGGDPEGNGTGGSDETIEGEFLSNGFKNTLSHKKGVISMARSQNPNSASSQFFIVESDSEFLDGEYAAFGYVTDGMDIVEKIAEDAKPVDSNGTIDPTEQPVITSITVTEAE